MKRRSFIRQTAVVSAGLGFLPASSRVLLLKTRGLESNRPPYKERTFVSDSVESFINRVKMDIPDPELAWLFENCFPNTLDTTIRMGMVGNKPDTFVITGDIPAMWLRDSTCQVWPYLSLAKEEEKLQTMLQGIVFRQINSILIDPYANAFLYDTNEKSQWIEDITEMRAGVHERKFEVDSLCYAVRLFHGYWKATGDSSVFDDNWEKAVGLILKVFHKQQKKDGDNPDYSFMRCSRLPHETVDNNGNGRRVKPVGLICSPFRPSDDSTLFQFLIPSNYFALRSLYNLEEIYVSLFPQHEKLQEVRALIYELKGALEVNATIIHPEAGTILAYEIDGFGSCLLEDEPNIPNLLSLPYLNCMDIADPLYQNTRKFILSENNPYFIKGKNTEGYSSPHISNNYIWHLSIIMRALTSSDKEEIKRCLGMIKSTHAGTGFMHEGFDRNNPEKYTRSWFSWANSLFGELVVKLWNEMPDLLAT